MPSYNSTSRVPFKTGGRVGLNKGTDFKVKKAKTTPGKWGQKQLIERRERELEKVKEEGVPYVPDALVKRSIKKRIKKLKADKKYKTGKSYEKHYEKGMGIYEKGEHYNKGGRVGKQIGGRANLLEEVGRIDAERMNPNRRAEKARVIGELNRGFNKGGRVGLEHGSPHYIKKKPVYIKKKEKPEVKTSQGQAGLKQKLKVDPKKEYITKKKKWITKKKDYETGEHYNKGGRVGLKKGGNGKWIQSATASIKRRGTEGVCTGKKFGGPTCPPGSKRYNLAKTFKAMGKERKKEA